MFASRRTANAIDVSSIADDDELCASCESVEPSAPRRRPKPRTNPRPTAPGAEVPLDHGDLREVALRIGDRLAAALLRLVDERLRDDLPGHEADHARRAAAPRDPEHLRPERADPHRVPNPVGHRRARDLLDRLAALQHELRHEALEVAEQQQVGLAPGRDRAEMVEPVVVRGVVRRHHERVLGRDAELDRVAHHRVDVPVLGDVLRLAVVGAERDAVRPVLGDERQQRAQVARRRRLADEQPHPGAQPLASLVERRRLVVGADPRRRVRLQIPAADARRVAVDVRRERELRELGARRRRRRPGKFIISATPSTRRRRSSASRSPSVSARRGDSYSDAGTDDEAMKYTSSGMPAEASSSQCTPSVPRTFAISCGSATTAVVPSGSTRRANSSGSSFDDSRCMCASMKPGTT